MKFKDTPQQSNELKDIKFVITGTINNMSRTQLKSNLEKYGAIISSSISAKTDYLILGDNPGKNKLTKAKKLNIKIIRESDVAGLINV